MKNKPVINLLFIGVVIILIFLAVMNMITRDDTLTTSTELVSPTMNVAQSVTQTMYASFAATQPALPTNTPLPPTPIAEPPTETPYAFPNSFYIYSFVPHKQTYNIGCEASVAVDLAAFYHIYLTEYDFQINLPHSDNPDKGFVGDVNGPWGQVPPDAYGVHAAPVADLLNEYGVEVEGGKGYSLEQIKASLSQSHPVIVWVIGSMQYSEPVEYTDTEGITTIVAPYEHVVVLTGYNETSVRYVSNGHWADAANETFLTSWGVLGNMAVMHP